VYAVTFELGFAEGASIARRTLFLQEFAESYPSDPPFYPEMMAVVTYFAVGPFLNSTLRLNTFQVTLGAVGNRSIATMW
jgi:hypothetical protein